MAAADAVDAPSTRAATVAEEQGLGAYRRSFRVNRDHDRRTGGALLLTPVAAALFLKMSYDVSPWGHSSLGPSTLGMLATGVSGLIFLGIGVLLGVPALVNAIRGRGAWVHVFDQGAIAERTGGKLYSWPYRRATARYVCWRESVEGQWRDRPQLWISFHVDGETICFDGLRSRDREVLAQLAREFGIGDEPEPVDGIYRNTAPLPF